MQYKRFPEAIPLTSDGSVSAIGWTGERSFIVNALTKLEGGAEARAIFDLDGNETIDQGEILSLWEWATINDITVSELSELQDSLETYIEIEGIED